MKDLSKSLLAAYAATHHVNFTDLVGLVEGIVTDEQKDVIDLLRARLDQMAADAPGDDSEWASAYDDGWHSASLQICANILSPSVMANIRADMGK